eukprot:scaffold1305_cov248-Pinguiococcus_pyrenoidosus.AAC.4
MRATGAVVECTEKASSKVCLRFVAERNFRWLLDEYELAHDALCSVADAKGGRYPAVGTGKFVDGRYDSGEEELVVAEVGQQGPEGQSIEEGQQDP